MTDKQKIETVKAAQTALASPLLTDFWSQVEGQLDRIEAEKRQVKPRSVMDEAPAK